MLTIICGENTVASREYFNKLKDELKSKGNDIHHISPQNLTQISFFPAASPTLFGQKIVYLTENLLPKFKGKSLPELTIIDWEEKSLYELKIPKGAVVKEFKPSVSIFKLLDACYPGNLKAFLDILNDLPSKMDEGFIFIMLTRYIRNLILIKMGEKIARLQSWQLAKLKNQSRYWPKDKLIGFYEGLYRIEVGIKTGKNALPLRKSLDLLSMYFL